MQRIMILWLALVSLLVSGVSAEACQVLRKPIFDVAGNILTSVSVTITKTRGGATATLYTDPACTATTTNPVLTGSDGTFTVYIKDGVYTITPVKTGYAFATVVDIAIFEPVLENVIPNSQYATLDITAATTGAVDMIGATVATLEITQPATAITTKTVPSTTSIVFKGQGSITVSAGQTLTVNGPVHNLTDHAVWLGTGTTTFGTAAGPDPYGTRGKPVTVTYSAAMTIDASLGTTFNITATNNTNFAIALPTKPAIGRRILIRILNTSGGALGTATFTSYKMGAAWTQPATGTNRAIEFEYVSSAWVEVSRSAADVTNP